MKNLTKSIKKSGIVKGVAFVRLNQVTGTELLATYPSGALPPNVCEILRVKVWLSYGSTLLSKLPYISFLDMQEHDIAGYVFFNESKRWGIFAIASLFSREFIPLILKLEKKVKSLIFRSIDSIEMCEDVDSVLRKLYTELCRFMRNSDTIVALIGEIASELQKYVEILRSHEKKTPPIMFKDDA
ncbi:MAG: hypothetical protein ACTSXJ_01130 [Candidatus Baldrarchaeia archaeon]